MSQKNDNFIDKTFTVLADILLKVLPATKDEKRAFSYYRYGMSAQSSGDYAEALENYYEALNIDNNNIEYLSKIQALETLNNMKKEYNIQRYNIHKTIGKRYEYSF